MITDEIAKKIIEAANKACSECQEWCCEECEYRRWRTNEVENVKYEDIPGGMTNRQYLATLSNEELSNVIYDVIVDRIGYRYTSSRQGISQWLGELYRKEDFT